MLRGLETLSQVVNSIMLNIALSLVNSTTGIIPLKFLPQIIIWNWNRQQIIKNLTQSELCKFIKVFDLHL